MMRETAMDPIMFARFLKKPSQLRLVEMIPTLICGWFAQEANLICFRVIIVWPQGVHDGSFLLIIFAPFVFSITTACSLLIFYWFVLRVASFT